MSIPQSPSDSGSEQTGDVSARPQRNDRISPLVLILLLSFWVYQSSFLQSIKWNSRHLSISRSAAGTEGVLPTDVEDGILQIDEQAKYSYVKLPNAGSQQRLTAMLGRTKSDSRRAALNDATKLLAKYPQQIGLARRVILLRAESGESDPLGLQNSPTGKALVHPLGSYTPVAGSSPAASAELSDEQSLWRALFAAGPLRLTPQQKTLLATRIRALPQIRWWGKLALHQLYVRSGDQASAQKVLDEAAAEARRSAMGGTFLGLLAILAALAGVCSLGVWIFRSAGGDRTGGSLFDVTAPLIADEDRRLGAGDLANIFCAYFILSLGVQLSVSLLLSRLLGHEAQHWSSMRLLTIHIMATAVAVFLGGLLTLMLLRWLARRRGADLRLEIGLNAGAQPLWQVLLFGALGWGISLVLFIGVELVLRPILHSAPAPANPIIPLLMTAPGGLASVVLFILVALIAPFFEETIFRGVFFNGARLRMGAPAAILVTGLAFGLTHPVGIAEQLSLATFGAVLAWMAQTRKSLLPGMMAHCLQNSFAYASLLTSLMLASSPS